MIWARSAAFQLYFHLMTALLAVPGALVLVFAPGRSAGMGRLWARATLAGLRALCGVRFELSGRENLPRGACVVASRHESAFDTFVWLVLLPRCVYVAKAELGRIPVVGALMRRAGMVVVDREGGAPALRGMLRGALAAAEAGRPVVIFPEGTRMPPGVPGAIQPGVAALAAALRLPVVPVATDSGLRWGRRAFRIAPGLVRVVVRPPLPPGAGRAALVAGLASGMRLDPVDKSVGGGR